MSQDKNIQKTSNDEPEEHIGREDHVIKNTKQKRPYGRFCED